MKIENEYNPYVDSFKQKNEHRQLKDNKVIGSSDFVQVDLSDAAKKILSNSNEKDSDLKIAQIKAAINDGTYQVSSKKITEKILNEIENQKL